MKIGIVACTDGGRKLGRRIAGQLPGSSLLEAESSIRAALKLAWHSCDAVVCIMASGIVVRTLAPLMQDKRSDPAVLVLDEQGKHVISLLSGHLGGANALARQIAAITGGSAVITTASDTLGLVALDLWAAQQHLRCDSNQVLTKASAKLVNNGSLALYSETAIEELPPGLIAVDCEAEADLLVSHRNISTDKPLLHPANLVVGIGCNRNTPLEEFEEALAELFRDAVFSPLAIRNLASIDVKNDEEGLLLFARKNGWPITFFSRRQINTVTGVSISKAAVKAVGAIGVAEPTALLSAQTSTLLTRKKKWQNITMAVAQAPFSLSAQVRDPLNT
ncbi:MAG: cobalamin biosynthesis protein [Desulfopila sp.]|jgi:cobalt-precorrin 5A hydrolase|nr:cobalamin biosynthesis protein [Desulfopila sp.]